MRVAGIAVAMTSRQRPTTYLIVLNDSSGNDVIETGQASASRMGTLLAAILPGV